MPRLKALERLHFGDVLRLDDHLEGVCRVELRDVEKHVALHCTLLFDELGEPCPHRVLLTSHAARPVEQEEGVHHAARGFDGTLVGARGFDGTLVGVVIDSGRGCANQAHDCRG